MIIARVFAAVAVFAVAALSASAGFAESVTINGARINGTCIHEYELYENDPTHTAFAVSRNGDYCGYSYGYDTIAQAEDRALAECRSRGRGCRVIASY